MTMSATGFINYFDWLKLSHNPSQRDALQAFRRALRDYHPDSRSRDRTPREVFRAGILTRHLNSGFDLWRDMNESMNPLDQGTTRSMTGRGTLASWRKKHQEAIAKYFNTHATDGSDATGTVPREAEPTDSQYRNAGFEPPTRYKTEEESDSDETEESSPEPMSSGRTHENKNETNNSPPHSAGGTAEPTMNEPEDSTAWFMRPRARRPYGSAPQPDNAKSYETDTPPEQSKPTETRATASNDSKSEPANANEPSGGAKRKFETFTSDESWPRSHEPKRPANVTHGWPKSSTWTRNHDWDELIKGIESGTPCGEYTHDPIPKRAVFASFNKNGSLLRRVSKFDLNGRLVLNGEDRTYKQIKATQIAPTDIDFLPEWNGGSKDDHARLVFEDLVRRDRLDSFPWASFSHYKCYSSLPAEFQDLQMRLRGSYEWAKPHKAHGLDEAHRAGAEFEPVGLNAAEDLLESFQEKTKALEAAYHAAKGGDFDAIDRFYANVHQSIDQLRQSITSASARVGRAAFSTYRNMKPDGSDAMPNV